MSLIFQSLQKTQQMHPDHETDAGQGATALERPSSGRAWMRPILIGLVLFLSLGVGAVYAVQYLKERLPTESVAGNSRQVGPVTTRAVQQHVESVPGSLPETIPVETAAAVVETRFYPPEAQKAPAKSADAVSPVAMVSSVADETLSSQGSQIAPLQKPVAAVSATAAEGSDGVGTTIDAEAAAYAAQRDAIRKARAQASRKRSRIGRLVRQIEQNIAGGGDPGRTTDLLDRLARMKGRDHPYVVKLRAYWHLKMNQYVLAAIELHKVTAANPDDLEAGINLALIEIHNRQYPKALDRLKRLRQTHPEDGAVADLIKRLQ